jgi:hypothetical protein
MEIIVGFHRYRQKCRHPQIILLVHHLLRQLEAQHILQQLRGAIDIVAVQQAVVEASGTHALEFFRPGLGILFCQAPFTGLLLLGE